MFSRDRHPVAVLDGPRECEEIHSVPKDCLESFGSFEDTNEDTNEDTDPVGGIYLFYYQQ
jgi:hypothetical protein